MNRPSPLFFLGVLLLFLLPTAAGRFLLDLAGGLLLAALVLPLLLTGVGWIGWRVIQSRMVVCEVCGMRTFGSAGQCPVCGSGLNRSSDSGGSSQSSSDASSATIDVIAKDEGSES